jgi:hydrophobe/amphiphile efflux-1 (HAE1) family protein
MLSEFFVRRPIFAAVISIVIVLLGVVSQGKLPVAKFPEITPPTVSVTAVYPGANASVVAETVAAPIEQEVNGVEGMIYMSSNSANDGSYSLTVTFEVGTDMDMAAVLVQNRVAIAMAKLPDEVKRQGVVTKKKSTSILQFVTVYSKDDSRTALELNNFALSNIRDELSRIDGVGEVQVFGIGEYSMRIWLDPTQLVARSMTPADVVGAIREQNVQVAAGQVGSTPTPKTTAYQYTIKTLGRLEDVTEFENIIVKTGEDGRYIRVKDVARVELGSKDYRYTASFNGQDCAALAIYQLPSANALEVADAVGKKLEELSKSFPQGYDYQIPFDSTSFVTASVEEVYTTLFQAILLVVAVIFIFLQDWRATLIPCAAIPVSLIGTFAVMAGVGFSINMLTLFGVILAIGIVVDDAIVVVENTAKHLDSGQGPKEATIAAMKEITGPVVATTLVLLAVFVPTLFLQGITGQMYRQFSLTICGAVVISSINALTLSPALCGILMRPTPEKRFFLFEWFNKVFDWVTFGYTGVIRIMVRRVAIVIVIFIGMVVLTGMGFTRLPGGFIPDEDQGYMFSHVELPDAASLDRTVDTTAQLDAIAGKTPGVANVVSVSGYSLLSGAAGSNLAFQIVILNPWEERTTPDLRIGTLLRKYNGALRQVETAIAFAFLPPSIDGLGASGGFQMQVEDRGGLGLEALEEFTQSMIEAGNGQSALTRLNTTFRSSTPQLFADVDRTQVKTMGIPLTSVFDTLQTYMGSAYVNDFNMNGRTYQVRVQAEGEYRDRPSDIGRLELRNAAGKMVPLGSFVDIQPAFGPQVIQRYQMYPSAAITGSPTAGFSSGEALAIMEQLADSSLPQGMGFDWTGMSYQEAQVGSEQYVIFLLSVVFVFLVLSAQYESWTLPAAVIAVVPLSAAGVVGALLLRGMDNNIYTQIGIVLLVALASKNAILIVEFARDLREGGKTLREAAVGAAQARFRAILMTAFSSILGFLPLLVAAGAGAASRQAVGTCVVGGMAVATLASLLFVPAFFVLFQGFAGLLNRKKEA